MQKFVIQVWERLEEEDEPIQDEALTPAHDAGSANIASTANSSSHPSSPPPSPELAGAVESKASESSSVEVASGGENNVVTAAAALAKGAQRDQRRTHVQGFANTACATVRRGRANSILFAA